MLKTIFFIDSTSYSDYTDLEFYRMFIILVQIDVIAGTEHSIITKS